MKRRQKRLALDFAIPSRCVTYAQGRKLFAEMRRKLEAKFGNSRNKELAN